MVEQSFQDLFSKAYTRAKTGDARKAVQLRESLVIQDALGAELGHPDFEALEVGQTNESDGVVFFLDIRGFTKLSFVLPNEELLWILQALTEAAVRSVLQFGGHVIEFTGDGIMAVFGDSRTASEAAAFGALHTTAFLMKGIQDYVNPQLQRAGTEAVRIAVGMEFGEILWSRIGILNKSQVKPISEATFLAGKLSCGGRTKAWEAMVGANLAEWIPDEFKVAAPRYEFVADGEKYSRDLFFFKWSEFRTRNQLRPAELRKVLLGRRLTSARNSAYFAGLKRLTESGFKVLFEDSGDCPHLVVELDKRADLSAIITFSSSSARSVPGIFLRRSGNLERIDIDPSHWEQSGEDIAALIAAVRRAS